MASSKYTFILCTLGVLCVLPLIIGIVIILSQTLDKDVTERTRDYMISIAIYIITIPTSLSLLIAGSIFIVSYIRKRNKDAIGDDERVRINESLANATDHPCDKCNGGTNIPPCKCKGTFKMQCPNHSYSENPMINVPDIRHGTISASMGIPYSVTIDAGVKSIRCDRCDKDNNITCPCFWTGDRKGFWCYACRNKGSIRY